MKKKGLPIIIVSREKLYVVVVADVRRRHITSQKEYLWNQDTLETVFQAIDQDYTIGRVRFLFTKSVSYVLRIPIPKDIAREKKHQYIVSSLSDRIPENFENAYWDYSEVEGKDGNVALVFVPVQEILSSIVSSARLLGWEIEIIGAEEIVVREDENPIFGLAKHKEKQVWQIGKGEEIKDEVKKNNRSLWILVVIVLAFLLSSIIFFRESILNSMKNIFSITTSSQETGTNNQESSKEFENPRENENQLTEHEGLVEIKKNVDLESVTILVQSSNALSSVSLIELLKGFGYLQFEEEIDRARSATDKTIITISHPDYDVIEQSIKSALSKEYNLEFQKGTNTKYDVNILLESK